MYGVGVENFDIYQNRVDVIQKSFRPHFESSKACHIVVGGVNFRKTDEITEYSRQPRQKLTRTKMLCQLRKLLFDCFRIPVPAFHNLELLKSMCDLVPYLLNW